MAGPTIAERLGPAAAVIAAGLAIGACAPWLERPFAGVRGRPPVDREPVVLTPFGRPVPCGAAPFPSRLVDIPRRDKVVIGSVSFHGLGHAYPATRFAPGAPALTVPLVVPPRSRVTVAVPPGQRSVAGVDGSPVPASTPADAHRAVRCVTANTTEVFTVSFVIDGARCVPVAVTIDGVTTTRAVAFGVRRC